MKVFLKLGSSDLVCQTRIFEGESIHGILARENIQNDEDLQLVIWGGSSISLFTKAKFRSLLEGNEKGFTDLATVAPDWILDVTWSSWDHLSCHFVTAHNTVFRARLAESKERTVVETLSSPSRSILYSAHLICEDARILVAAGTVFGEIIVWECGSSGSNQVLFTFTGHEGSIFGVNISDLAYLADGSKGRLLASCSDDRTIRVWDLAPRTALSAKEEDSVLRETGFGQNNGAGSAERCIATMMGHASRIWSVKFLSSVTSDLPHSRPELFRLLSFGEDSTVRLWELDLVASTWSSDTKSANYSNPRAAIATHLETFAFHSGKHIWSAALRGRTQIAAGGADGKISQFTIDIDRRLAQVPTHTNCDDLIEQLNTRSSHSWDIECIPPWTKETISSNVEPQPVPPSDFESLEIGTPLVVPKKKKKPAKISKDGFNQYAIVSADILLVTTNFGRVLRKQREKNLDWQEIELPEAGNNDLRSYAVVKAIPEYGLVYLAGSNGKIYRWHDVDELTLAGEVIGKIADMFKIYRPSTKTFELFVTVLGGSTATLFQIDDSYEEKGKFLHCINFSIPAKFVVTSAGMSNKIFILGSRSGSLAIYDPEHPEEPLTLWTSAKRHSEDAITSIIPIEPLTPLSTINYFLTTCRDGTYSIFSYRTGDKTTPKTKDVKLQIVHQGSPPFGPMIEAAWFEGGDLYMYGFRGKNFIVWNETKQWEILSIECGGAHRSYAYLPVEGRHIGGQLVYTKASEMRYHRNINGSHRIMKSGGHGREIKACAVSTNQKFVATGAEDTTIRIWEYKGCNSLLKNQFCCKAVVQKHTTGIQHLQWYNSKYLFSSGGNEEFFVWAIETIPGFGIGIVCEATCPDQSEEKDLRIMSFDVSEYSFSNSDADDKLLISMAFSDSTIHTYTYSRDEGFYLLAKGRYTSACLMQIRHLNITGNEIHILTAATDGRLVLWTATCHGTQEVSATFAILSTKTVHQNSIKSLDIIPSNDRFLVATGGDDNAFGISVYSKQNVLDAPVSFVVRNAHAAAITGICFVSAKSCEDGSQNVRVVSSSNDQRVKEWNISVHFEEEEECRVTIRRTGNVFTNVADIGDVVPLISGKEDKVLIVGNGMEVWKVSCKS